MQGQQITWRSFWCGAQGTGGPIPQQFSVRGWPTIYLIDAKGVIRNKWLGNPGDEKIDEAIDKLCVAWQVPIDVQWESLDADKWDRSRAIYFRARDVT